ncbi:MAG TPA: hypothetical protein VK929_06335 [Longimicrobiales bacterium]|nr:hypothetical protein [Longimicrobiales bacterium]
MRRVAGVLVLAVVLTAGAISWHGHSRVARQDSVLSARRELAATQLAPAGVAPRAGVSARAPIRVQPISRQLSRRIRNEPDFQRFSHRCGVCHASPDPGLYTAREWDDVVSRMSHTIDAAGLLPLSEADQAAVLRVLKAYARY